jgi:hypothetical protein
MISNRPSTLIKKQLYEQRPIRTPPPSPFSQPEITPTFAGHEWNNGVTRRSFLKRTGGATVATIISLHLTSTSANAYPNATGASDEVLLSEEVEFKAVSITTPATYATAAEAKAAARALAGAEFKKFNTRNQDYGREPKEYVYSLDDDFTISPLPQSGGGFKGNAVRATAGWKKVVYRR